MIGHVVVDQLTAEDLNEEQKELRDDLLKSLQEHIEDVSSYSRSKALQVWDYLKQQSAIPLKNHLTILKAVIDRLEDRTATVRKNATTLLQSFLETNPFASRVNFVVLLLSTHVIVS